MTLSTPTPFERGLVRGATLEDLDLEALEAYLGRRAPRLLERMPLEQAAQRVGLIAKSTSAVGPTVAGLLLFGFHPQLLYPEWGVAAVRVDGRVLSDSVALREDLEGSLPELIDGALEFAKRHTKSLPNQIELDERAEEYPPQALREAMVNALVHRDWRLPGRVALRIYDDRLEIWSPGGPLSILTLTLEELSSVGGVSFPRNPLIAATCRALGLGEQLGRGLPTVRRAVSESAGESMTFVTSKTEVLVIIPSALHARKQTS